MFCFYSKKDLNLRDGFIMDSHILVYSSYTENIIDAHYCTLHQNWSLSPTCESRKVKISLRLKNGTCSHILQNGLFSFNAHSQSTVWIFTTVVKQVSRIVTSEEKPVKKWLWRLELTSLH